MTKRVIESHTELSFTNALLCGVGGRLRQVEVHRVVADAAALAELLELDALDLHLLKPWRTITWPPK